MNNSGELEKDAKSALNDVDRLKDEIVEFSELNAISSGLSESDDRVKDDLAEFQQRSAELLDRIRNVLGQIIESGSHNSYDGAAFSLSTLTNELNAQLDWLLGILEQLEEMILTSTVSVSQNFIRTVGQSARSAIQKIKAYLKPLLKKLLSKVWQIISNLMTPKEWKLQGKVGTGLLGLTEVGIEITFGP